MKFLLDKFLAGTILLVGLMLLALVYTLHSIITPEENENTNA